MIIVSRKSPLRAPSRLPRTLTRIRQSKLLLLLVLDPRSRHCSRPPSLNMQLQKKFNICDQSVQRTVNFFFRPLKSNKQCFLPGTGEAFQNLRAKILFSSRTRNINWKSYPLHTTCIEKWVLINISGPLHLFIVMVVREPGSKNTCLQVSIQYLSRTVSIKRCPSSIQTQTTLNIIRDILSQPTSEPVTHDKISDKMATA
jgi:hypothetical protein